MLGASPQDCFDDTIIPYHSGKKHAENDHICTAFRRTFLRNWPLIRTHSHITAQARRYKVFAALTVGSVQRMLLEPLQRLFIPQFCIEYQVIVPSGQVEANFNAQQAIDPAPHGGNGIL